MCCVCGGTTSGDLRFSSSSYSAAAFFFSLEECTKEKKKKKEREGEEMRSLSDSYDRLSQHHFFRIARILKHI
jgi:hypothetical protein